MHEGVAKPPVFGQKVHAPVAYLACERLHLGRKAPFVTHVGCLVQRLGNKSFVRASELLATHATVLGVPKRFSETRDAFVWSPGALTPHAGTGLREFHDAPPRTLATEMRPAGTGVFDGVCRVADGARHSSFIKRTQKNRRAKNVCRGEGH